MKIKTTDTEIEVTLTMNRSEAEAMLAVCGNIGGAGLGRQLFLDILEGLEDAGIEHKRRLINKDGIGYERYQALYFR